MNLTSICLATQQGVSLNRLSGYSNCLSRIRDILGSKPDLSATAVLPNWDQLYVWQTLIMLLNISVVLFIVGIVILVFDGLADIVLSERSVKVGNKVSRPP